MENMFYLFDQINLTLLDSWWLTLLVGILLCFFGFKIFDKSLFWFGILLGGVIGYGIGNVLYQLVGGVVGAVILGIVCGYLFRAVMRIGIFLGGLLIGGLVGTTLFEHSPWVIPIIIFSGILAAVFFRYFIMIATALWGAMLLTGTLAAVSAFSLSEYALEIITIEIAVFVGGLFYQLSHMRKSSKLVEQK